MANQEIKLPAYNKLAHILIGIIGVFFIMYVGQSIMVPLVFALIIAILINPVVNFLVKKNVNRILAIFLALLGTLALLGGLVYFIGWQISEISETADPLKQKFSLLLNEIVDWISRTFNIRKAKINAWIEHTKGQGISNGTVIIGQTLTTVMGILAYLFLIPVYIFLFLFYKPLLLEFVARLFARSQHNLVEEVLTESKGLIQNYLLGLLVEMAIVATLNSAGLLIIGLDYAILIGIIGALLNIIPYIGGLVAITIPVVLAIATKSPVDALWVVVVYLVVQAIDNNFIVPKIVAGKVKINALVSIIVVLIGGALWGAAGMFLAVPLTAIMKVIFDRIPPLAPVGFLLGDNQPKIGKIVFRFKRKPESKPAKKLPVEK